MKGGRKAIGWVKNEEGRADKEEEEVSKADRERDRRGEYGGSEGKKTLRTGRQSSAGINDHDRPVMGRGGERSLLWKVIKERVEQGK